MRLIVQRTNPRTFYRVMGSRSEFVLTLLEDFWHEGSVNPTTAQSAFDFNVDALCSEVRYGLYYVATLDQQKH